MEETFKMLIDTATATGRRLEYVVERMTLNADDDPDDRPPQIILYTPVSFRDGTQPSQTYNTGDTISTTVQIVTLQRSIGPGPIPPRDGLAQYTSSVFLTDSIGSTLDLMGLLAIDAYPTWDSTDDWQVTLRIKQSQDINGQAANGTDLRDYLGINIYLEFYNLLDGIENPYLWVPIEIDF